MEAPSEVRNTEERKADSTPTARRPYTAPCLVEWGSLQSLTQGFFGGDRDGVGMGGSTV